MNGKTQTEQENLPRTQGWMRSGHAASHGDLRQEIFPALQAGLKDLIGSVVAWLLAVCRTILGKKLWELLRRKVGIFPILSTNSEKQGVVARGGRRDASIGAGVSFVLVCAQPLVTVAFRSRHH
jgi:hypothetical protein